MKQPEIQENNPQRPPALADATGYAAIQAQLLDLIGKAGEATKAATNANELQACGQLTRRLCHALTGL